MNPEDKVADRRSHAIHEAGHVTVATIRGLRVSAEIDGPEDEPGRTTVEGGGQFDAPTAVAGMLAVEISYDYPNGTDETFNNDWNYFKHGLSWRDERLVPPESRRTAVTEALSILRRETRLFDKVVEGLLASGKLSADEIAELAAKYRAPPDQKSDEQTECH